MENIIYIQNIFVEKSRLLNFNYCICYDFLMHVVYVKLHDNSPLPKRLN